MVRSIASDLERWRDSLGSPAVSPIFEDPIQRARVAFLDLPPGGASSLELVEPLDAEAPTARFLEKSGGLHHLCFEVDDIEAQIALMKAQKAMLIRRPQPATAFQGRRIAWMLTREKLLVEYLERSLPA